MKTTPRESEATPSFFLVRAVLDNVIEVNSLFVVPLVLLFYLTMLGQLHSIHEHPSACDAARIDITKNRLLIFEVYSLIGFVLSYLVGGFMKLVITLSLTKDVKGLRFGLIGMALGTLMGGSFFILSMMCFVEIRLGAIACGSVATLSAVSVLCVLIPSGLLFYICCVVYVIRSV